MAEFNPKVSIVIPVYNGSNFLCEAIDSALAQTYKNFEVIVVNDGSNDEGKTEAIAKSYDDRIRYFCKENGGVATALNLGINKMTGEYFSWLSHDDVYDKKKIEKHINYINKIGGENIVSYCQSEFIDENSNIIRKSIIDSKYIRNKYLMILSTNIGGCSYLIPRACFKKAGYFNEKLRTTQDNEMWLRIAKQGYSFKYLPEVLVKYRIHSEQGSNKLFGYQKEEQNAFYSWAMKYIDKETKNIYTDLRDIIINKLCWKASSEVSHYKYENKIIIEFYSSIYHLKILYLLISSYIRRNLY